MYEKSSSYNGLFIKKAAGNMPAALTDFYNISNAYHNNSFAESLILLGSHCGSQTIFTSTFST